MTDRWRGPMYLVRYVLLVLAIMMVIVPLWILVVGSLEPSNLFFAHGGLWPSVLTLANYTHLLNNSQGTVPLENSIIVAVSTTIISVLIGGLAAYASVRLRTGRWIQLMLVGIILVRFYPKISLIIPYYMMMRRLGLLDTQIGLIIVYVGVTLPFSVLVLESFFRGLPSDMLEAGAMDGASELQIFLRIVSPLAAPGLAAASLLTVFVAWNEFLIASSLTSANAITLPVMLATFITDKGTNLGGLSAMSLLLIIPMVAVVVGAQRYIVQGLTVGAVKG